MSGYIFFLVFLGMVLFGIIQAFLAVKREKGRTESWRDVATELKMEFFGSQDDLLARYGHLKIFQQGSSRRIANAICGDWGSSRAALGDFRYVIRSGKNRRTRAFTVCVVENDGFDLPHCFLRPEGRFFDALGSMLGGQDIDFIDDPDFSNAYVLQGESESAIRELFDDKLRAWFVEHKDQRFVFEAERQALVFHTQKLRDPREAGEMLQQTLEIAAVLSKSRHS